MSGELLPCPFCGRGDDASNAVQESPISLVNGKCPMGGRRYRVECACGAKAGWQESPDVARIAWNTRPTPGINAGEGITPVPPVSREDVRRAVVAELDRQESIGAGNFHTDHITGLWEICADIDPNGFCDAILALITASPIPASGAGAVSKEAFRAAFDQLPFYEGEGHSFDDVWSAMIAAAPTGITGDVHAFANGERATCNDSLQVGDIDHHYLAQVDDIGGVGLELFAGNAKKGEGPT